MNQQKPGLLNTWKEIASYLGRGVRTVQRWEKMGLPVRRLGSGPRAPVIANHDDIDRWMQKARCRGVIAPAMVEQVLCKGDLRETIERSRMLREKLVLLRADQRQMVAELMSTISKLEKACVGLPADLSASPDPEIDLSHRRREPAREVLRMTA